MIQAIQKTSRILRKFTRIMNRVMMCAAGFMLVVMVILPCLDTFFSIEKVRENVPLNFSWSFELMGYFGALVVAFSLAVTQRHRENISVDILVDNFSPRVRFILAVINDLICCILFSIAAWQIAGVANRIRISGEVTETVNIPFYPFIYCISLGFAMLALVFVTDLLDRISAKGETG